jgi:hypothetical protein
LIREFRFFTEACSILLHGFSVTIKAALNNLAACVLAEIDSFLPCTARAEGGP